VRDCIEFFKIQNIHNAHLVDPFKAVPEFKQAELSKIIVCPHKIKIGMFRQCKFLPVSKSVQRAMDITKKALEDGGYCVVDFEVTEEELQLGAKYLMGICINKSIPGTVRDCYKHGENLQLDVWMQFFFFHRGPIAKWFIYKALKMLK